MLIPRRLEHLAHSQAPHPKSAIFSGEINPHMDGPSSILTSSPMIFSIPLTHPPSWAHCGFGHVQQSVASRLPHHFPSPRPTARLYLLAPVSKSGLHCLQAWTIKPTHIWFSLILHLPAGCRVQWRILRPWETAKSQNNEAWSPNLLGGELSRKLFMNE